MKTIHRKTTVEIADVDAVAVDEIKIERIDGGFLGTDRPRIHLIGREHTNECRTYETHYFSPPLEEMPHDLYSKLTEWAQGVMNRAVAAEVAKHEAEGVAA